MILWKSFNQAYSLVNFGPIPYGWRARALHFEASAANSTIPAFLRVCAGFFSSPVLSTAEFYPRCNTLIAGSTLEQGGFGASLVAFQGSATASPNWSFNLPCSLPLDVGVENYVCVELELIVNVNGIVSVDLIPLTPRELSRLRAGYRHYLLDALDE